MPPAARLIIALLSVAMEGVPGLRQHAYLRLRNMFYGPFAPLMDRIPFVNGKGGGWIIETGRGFARSGIDAIKDVLFSLVHNEVMFGLSTAIVHVTTKVRNWWNWIRSKIHLPWMGGPAPVEEAQAGDSDGEEDVHWAGPDVDEPALQ